MKWLAFAVLVLGGLAGCGEDEPEPYYPMPGDTPDTTSWTCADYIVRNIVAPADCERSTP